MGFFCKKLEDTGGIGEGETMSRCGMRRNGKKTAYIDRFGYSGSAQVRKV